MGLIGILNKFLSLKPKPTLPIKTYEKRMSYSVDDIISWVVDVLEGGDKVITDTGGLTKYGISQKANPDVDVRFLSKAEAIEIYKERYWFKNNCQDFEYPYNLILFDSAVNTGLVTDLKVQIAAKYRWQDLLFKRLLYYSSLMEGKTKYDIYAEGWLNRILKIYRKIKGDGF